MKKQAREMQSQMSQMQDNMQTTLVEASAGNGLVTVVLNGAKDLKKITINPETVSDVEGLQDLIITAFDNAAKKIDSESSSAKLPFNLG